MELAANPDIQAVAFDLDGLMFNTEDLYVDVAEELLRRRGLELDMRLIRAMMGRPARVAIPIMIDWYNLSDSVDELEEETQDVFGELLPTRLEPMPGLLQLIAEIDRLGLPKAIATSSRRPYVERILGLANLQTTFEFMLTADDIQQGKPHPEIYLRAASRFGVDAQSMLVLEDSVPGCHAAVAAEAVTVAVPTQHSRQDDYPNVHLRLDSLEDRQLRAVLNGST